MPCLHSFCGGCFSDWVKRQKDCPSCRNPVVEVKKSAMINSLVENFLSINPGSKRQDAELKELETKNLFKNDVVSV
jgi:E3 ubiquitin-protein ligase CHFR